MNRKFMGPVAAILLLSACNNADKKEAKGDILLANVDTTINPADDFFQYANGGWIKGHPIPDDETGWGIAYLVQDELYARLLHINEEAVKNKNATGTDKQIADFWQTAMDTVTIEKQGIAPLQPELDKIAALQTKEEVMKQAADMHRYGVGVFFGEGVGQDAMNSEVMSYTLWQGGLGLPNRDYYFNTDERTTNIRDAYPGYISKVFQLTGVPAAEADAKAAGIVALETKLAEKSRKLEDLRDPYANYNKMAVSNLKKISPTIDWAATIKEIGANNVDTVIVGQPEFYTQLDKVLSATDIQVLKDYMAFHLVKDMGSYLSNAFVDANFDYYSKLIYGAKENKPRWKRVLNAEEGAMGEALGQLFAKEYFNDRAKKRYEDIVENVRTAYKARIDNLGWMTDSTKQKAQAKLAAITKKVGYPDKWKDFSSLKIGRESYAQNMMSAHMWWNTYDLAKLGKPVDRNEWDMTPQTYNAYYNPSNNEIVLPAGIFTVPGYRDEELDDALVYGYAAASTVGHEITHGFDDEGRQFDAKGNLKNWWAKMDEEQFTQRANVLVGQFNQFMPVDTMHINGAATLGENLADLGGILIGLDAFKQTETYKKGEKISGFTPLQRFFLGYALGWMYEIRKESLASRIMTDVHSPAKYRVNGPFPNVPEFYEAFNVQPGNKMYLPDSMRVKLW
ncbi:MAG: M13 family metallopeptidase [Chitinophagaceae bacterium]|nr:M13 family metallopeptidase [Chitinophagaceae bacterium]MCB9045878.1 M13 family metallopeptidase [Chitinophagales bacterium]